MSSYIYFILIVGTLLWFLPFLLAKWNFKTAETTDFHARWGMLLELIGYAVLWMGRFWARTPAFWQIALSSFLFLLAALCSLTAVRALGKQLRIDAGLSSDHQLVQTGPYRFVRHPIYTSIFSMFLATGLLLASWPLLCAALTICLVGTEIRVRIEDNLLAARFGEQFRQYKRAVYAYLPPVR